MIYYVECETFNSKLRVFIGEKLFPSKQTKYVYKIEADSAEQAFFKLTSGKREDYLYWSKINGFVFQSDVDDRREIFEDLMVGYKKAKAEYEMDVSLSELTQK